MPSPLGGSPDVSGNLHCGNHDHEVGGEVLPSRAESALSDAATVAFSAAPKTEDVDASTLEGRTSLPDYSEPEPVSSKAATMTDAEMDARASDNKSLILAANYQIDVRIEIEATFILEMQQGLAIMEGKTQS